MVLKLNSIDTREKVHSSYFYPEIRPMGMICQAFGLFPFENSRGDNGLLLKYRIFSKVNIYSFSYTMVLTACYFIFMQFHTESLSIIRGYFFICLLWLIFFATQLTSSSLVTFIHKIEQLDLCLNKFNIQRKKKSQKLFLVCIIFYTMYIATVTMLGSRRVYHFSMKKSFMHTIHMSFKYFVKAHLILNPFLYICLCNGLSARIKTVNDAASDINFSSKHQNVLIFRKIQILQSKILSASKCLNRCSSIRLAGFFASTYVEILYIFYKYICEKNSNTGTGFLLIIYLSILLYLVAHYSQQMLTDSQQILIHLRNISLKNLTIPFIIQIKELMKQTIAEPVTISAAGYFQITNETLPVLTGSLASMMTIIIQVYLEMKNYLQQVDHLSTENPSIDDK